VMQRKFERKRELAYNAARHSFQAMARDPAFRDFVCLYIGEGYERNRNRVAIANSDPGVVEMAFRWISRLSKNKVSCSVQYHADQDPDMLREFWAIAWTLIRAQSAFCGSRTRVGSAPGRGEASSGC